jgi:hypothetical protein
MRIMAGPELFDGRGNFVDAHFVTSILVFDLSRSVKRS